MMIYPKDNQRRMLNALKNIRGQSISILSPVYCLITAILIQTISYLNLLLGFPVILHTILFHVGNVIVEEAGEVEPLSEKIQIKRASFLF